jgi:predicted RNase H-like HicB family nuclease
MNTKYEIVVYWSEQDDCFLAEVPELPKLITDGVTRVEALRNAEEMIDAYLKTASEAGWFVPEPGGRLAFA